MNLNKKDKLYFEDFHLSSGLILGLYSMGFQNGPSDIQALILPHSLSCQRNIIVQSKTGTGKTVNDVMMTAGDGVLSSGRAREDAPPPHPEEIFAGSKIFSADGHPLQKIFGYAPG